MRAVDPERILVPISGNMNDWGTAYDHPPGYSLPQECWNNVIDDFHCYNGWYQEKGEIRKFSKRRQPAARLVTVGEYGAEALDAYETMAEHYPPHSPPVPPIGLDAAVQDVPVVNVSLTLTDATGNLLSRYQREVFLKAWRLQDALFPKG